MSGRVGRWNASCSVQLCCPEEKGPYQMKQVMNIYEIIPTPLSDSSHVGLELNFFEAFLNSVLISISGLIHQKDEENKALHDQDNRFLEGNLENYAFLSTVILM